MSKILLTPLSRISAPGGDVMHIIKPNDPGFNCFGEAYFSTINYKAVKAWKKHSSMTLNLTVPYGSVKFCFQLSDESYQVIEIGTDSYSRITVPPGVWFGFKGLHQPFSLILNIADLAHDPSEVERRPNDAFSYSWSDI